MFENKELIIRQARKADVDSIVKLDLELMNYHVNIDPHYQVKENCFAMYQDFHSDMIDSENALSLVAELDGKVVGHILGRIRKTPPVMRTEEFGFINSIFVREEHRRKRIGEKLVFRLFEWFKSKGMTHVETAVDIRNHIGVAAYTKYGFQTYMYRLKKIF